MLTMAVLDCVSHLSEVAAGLVLWQRAVGHLLPEVVLCELEYQQVAIGLVPHRQQTDDVWVPQLGEELHFLLQTTPPFQREGRQCVSALERGIRVVAATDLERVQHGRIALVWSAVHPFHRHRFFCCGILDGVDTARMAWLSAQRGALRQQSLACNRRCARGEPKGSRARTCWPRRLQSCNEIQVHIVPS